MHPRIFAEKFPDKPAYIIAETGEAVSYGELEDAANRGAHLLRSLGLQRGDVIGVFLENNAFYFKIIWAAQRAGIYTTLISPKLAIDEVNYIVSNSGAKMLVSSPAVGPIAMEIAAYFPSIRFFMVGDARSPYKSYEEAIGAMPSVPIADESIGELMLYSSGTTGRPKGVKPRLMPAGTNLYTLSKMAEKSNLVFGFNEDSVYLSPAPLYHGAPSGTCMLVNRFGGTAIIMQKFDPEFALKLIEQYRVDRTQWVPTHFVRMLKLPEDTRKRYDLSSLKKAVHAAAPCPIAVKQAMIEWWGPIIDEYYAGTEQTGTTFIDATEWLQHKGSVGRAAPPYEVHICDEHGNELPPGEEGLVYFSGGPEFVYHGDPEKTASVRTRQGWTTLGDIGRLDKDGYLFLCDRKDFMIISGGVNIYPQEIEDLMLSHPAIMDVAVFGAPDDEMGERVVAVVQPIDWGAATPELAENIRAWVRSRMSHVKSPTSVEFMRELPRTPTGKLMKRLLRDGYRQRAYGEKV